MPTYKTAESVSPKHPDKICDQISDAVLDAYLTKDPDARVAIDVTGGHGVVFVTGEVSSVAKGVDIAQIVRRLAGDVKIIEHIAAQSPEISAGVDTGGAGDQGIMVGYATDETAERRFSTVTQQILVRSVAI
jgi:S-adenosylmethionine synthetase